jgi:hypothetical protein
VSKEQRWQTNGSFSQLRFGLPTMRSALSWHGICCHREQNEHATTGKPSSFKQYYKHTGKAHCTTGSHPIPSSPETDFTIQLPIALRRFGDTSQRSFGGYGCFSISRASVFNVNIDDHVRSAWNVSLNLFSNTWTYSDAFSAIFSRSSLSNRLCSLAFSRFSRSSSSFFCRASKR